MRQWIKQLFTRKITRSTIITPQFSNQTIPHTEEAKNPNATLENVDIEIVLNKRLTDWKVPPAYWQFWKIKIVISLKSPLIVNGNEVPAATYDIGGVRHLDVEPEWLNPGVIAHKQAHNAYALLSNKQKTDFAAIYTPLINNDPMIVLLYSQNEYGLTSVIEGHAEIYRYLWNQI